MITLWLILIVLSTILPTMSIICLISLVIIVLVR
jgi:hypothetical protein